MRFLTIAACLLLTACGTSYQVAPSTAKVASKLATAKRTNQHAKEQAAGIEVDTKRTEAEAGKSIMFIDDALDAILKRDYDRAVKELTSARLSVGLMREQLQQSLRNQESLRTSFEQTDRDLVAGEQEVEAVNKAMEKVVIQGAKDRAIVEEVDWGFLGVHIGALFYFFKSVLRLGFIGVIFLIVLGVALLILGATFGGPFLKAIGWLWGLLWRKKES